MTDKGKEETIRYKGKQGYAIGSLFLASVFIGVVSVVMILIGYGNSAKASPAMSLADKDELVYYRNKYGNLEMIMSSIDQEYYKDPNIDKFIETVMGEYLEYLGDPFLVYGDHDLSDFYESRSSGTHKGTGLLLEFRDGGVYVNSLLMGSPAVESDITIGDKILKYGGVDISDGNIPKFKEGDIVEIEFENKDGDVNIVELEYSEGKHSDVYVDEIDGYDYVKLGQFSGGLVDDLESQAEFTEKGLILDLRGNTGGDVSEVVYLCELLGVDAEIVLGSDRFDDPKVRSAHGMTKKPESLVFKTGDGKNSTYKGDIVVLVDDFSASASEMLSELLRHNAGATLVGTQTYGKGVAQKVMTTPRGGLLMIPISEYELDGGIKVDSEVGVEVDKEVGKVDSPDEYYYSRDVETDKVLQAGLDVLKGDKIE